MYLRYLYFNITCGLNALPYMGECQCISAKIIQIKSINKHLNTPASLRGILVLDYQALLDLLADFTSPTYWWVIPHVLKLFLAAVLLLLMKMDLCSNWNKLESIMCRSDFTRYLNYPYISLYVVEGRDTARLVLSSSFLKWVKSSFICELSLF